MSEQENAQSVLKEVRNIRLWGAILIAVLFFTIYLQHSEKEHFIMTAQRLESDIKTLQVQVFNLKKRDAAFDLVIERLKEKTNDQR